MILTFSNTRNVIQAERCLKEANIFYQVIPTPRSISSECGMCLRISISEIEVIKDLFSNKNILIVAQVEEEAK